jgi:diguanylate cyclase
MNSPATHSNPSELARETLRQLAMRRIPPTPDNYRTLYHEIAGTQISENFPDRSLKTVVSGLPRDTADQARLARQLDTAIGSGSWDGLRTALSEFISKSSAEQPNWGNLIRELLVQMEKHHSGLTPAKKREAVDHVLGSSTAPDLLYSRMQSVIKTWARNPLGADEALTNEPAPVATEPSADSAVSPGRTVTSTVNRGFNELRDLVVQLFDNVIATMVVDNAELTQETADISAALRTASGAEQFAQLTERLKKFSYRLHFVAEDQIELKAALLHLIQLIVDNISELVVEDQWLTGQISVVRELMQEPLNLRRLDDVERRMKDVIFKQSALKQSLNDAKERLKAMLATFVDRLADFSESTSDYHDKIEHCATKISEANDISELSDVLDEVMRETRVIQLNAQRSRDELNQMRSRVSESEAEVMRLHDELAHASEMVRHDPLTGALNRKGMNEALESEVARTKRQSSKLCLALLDIDNFKKLNDSLGHAAGDAALVHLAKVVQETIRPEDTLARYGGEEFVVILPDTPIENAVSAMVRVQRELTRRYFLNNNDKVLITFSCGVAELGEGEDPFETLKRADAGMYLAKRAGKNRVVPT